MVDEYTAGLKVLKTEMMGNIKTAYLLDCLDEQRVIPDQVKIGHYDLQHLFIYLTNGENTNEKSKETSLFQPCFNKRGTLQELP